MKVKNTRRRLRAASFGCAATIAFAWAAVAQAQETPDGGPTPVTEEEAEANPGITVTGSRLRGVAPVGSSVISLGQDDVIATGAVTTDRVIKQIPQVFDLGVSENSRAQSGGSGNIAYGNSVNLRGIGPFATLILVDGHRAVNNSRAFDPSVIPTLGLERVEVVADGASAIYGSDAIAGVVNLIPRRSLNGVETVARYGIAEEGDFSEYLLGAAIGKKWSSGQVMLAFEHVHRSALSGDNRDFFVSDQRAFGGGDYRVNRCAPGTIIAAGVSYAIPRQGVTQATASTLLPNTSNLCNDLIGQDLFPEQTYNSVNGTFTQEIVPWLTIFADGFYSKRKFLRQPAESSATLTVPQTNAFFVRPAGFAGTSYTIAYNFVNDLPQNSNPGSAENWQITPGVRVNLPFGDWQFEGLFAYGEGDDQANQYRGLNNGALNAALASADPATAFDPYGLGRTTAATLLAISNFESISPTLNTFHGYEARLNGTLFELPAGGVKLATGFERQEIDTALGSKRGIASVPVVMRYFARNVNSYYAELLVPVFGTANAVPGFERLEINAAIRHDRYSDVGKTTNPKFGVNWSPLPGLVFRGSYGTSFRAPLITQIYGNSNALFNQTYQNPVGAPLAGTALSGPNLNLKPEEATTWSLGADWDVTNSLRLTVTYFNIEYVNQVEGYLSDLAILAREAEFAGTGIILRGTAARDRVLELIAQGIGIGAGTFPGGNANNVTLFVDGRNNNLGRSITKGLDFTASWRVETQGAGSFGFNGNATYLLKYVSSITPNGTLVDRRNTIFQPLKFKARASVTWDYEEARVQLTATHVNGYTNNAIAVPQKVSSYTPVDLSVSWDIGDAGSKDFFASGLTIGFEIRNLFDVDPPYVNLAPSGNGSGGYDATVANPTGRLFAASVRKKF